MKELILQYVLNRLEEASTLKGIILFITSIFGLTIDASTTNNLVYIALGVVGLIGALLPNHLSDVNKNPKEVVHDNTLLENKDSTEEDSSSSSYNDKS